MASLYTPMLKAAWKTAIGQRRLWGYALFAGLLIGSGIGTAVLETLGDATNEYALDALLPTEGLRPLFAQAQATGTLAMVLLTGYTALLVMIAIGIVAFAVIGVNALMLAAAGTQKETCFRAARARFWPAAAAHVLGNAVAIGILAIWSRIFTNAAMVSSDATTATAIVGFVVTALLLMMIRLAMPFAIAGIALDRRGLGSALREAFALLHDRWLITIEASFLFTAANVAAFFTWIFGSIILAAPFALLFGIATTRHSSAFVITAITSGIITLVAYLLVLTLVYKTFLVTAWTLLYLRLTSPGTRPEPWLSRAFGKKTEQKTPYAR